MKKINKILNRDLYGFRFDLKLKFTALFLMVSIFEVSAGNYAELSKVTLKYEKNNQEEIEITGTVLDENNQPLPAATVMAKGDKSGTLTDLDGKFKIRVPKGTKILVISYIGYENSEILIGDKTIINVKMVSTTKSLDEVVVVGYGTQKKSDVMRSFFGYLHETLSPKGIVISADLFGMTTTNFDDLNIGQVLEDALPNFGDPNQHVYEVVKYSMDRAVERTIATTTKVFIPNARIGTSTPAMYEKPAFDRRKLRPWLQDNNYPVPYTAQMVRDQIKAAYDAGLDSWLLWNAGNRYTRAALEPAL